MQKPAETSRAGQSGVVGWVMGLALAVSAAAAWVPGGTWAVPVWAAAAAAVVWAGCAAGQAWVRWAGTLLFLTPVIRLLFWETYPNLFGGQSMAPMPLRAMAFLITVAALGVAAYVQARFKGDRRQFWGLVGAASLVAFWYLTLEVTAAFDAAHNGRVAGHESLAIAGAWGLFGLGMALANRVWPHSYVRLGARAVLGAALTFLLMGSLLGNARWAFVPYRFFGYAAVLGGAWLAEYLFERDPDEDDVQGILSLVAALGGFAVCSFEVVRWLEPAFTHPPDALLSLKEFAWQRSMLGFWRVASWSGFAVCLMTAGVWLRSARARQMALAALGLSLAYGLWLTATNPAAIAWVRWVAFTAAVGGSLLAARLGRRVSGMQRVEAVAVKVLPWAAGAIAVAWVALDLV